MESWSRHTLEEMTDKLGELLGEEGRIVTTYPLDLGIFFTSLDVKFLEGSALDLNSSFMRALSNPLDFTTVTEVAKLDMDSLYSDNIPIQSRLISIAKVLKELNM